MTRNELRKGDMACLGQLINGPLEIGAISEETIERLVDRGLIVQVLGCCEITSSGQLSYHRQQYPRAPRTWVVSAAHNNPLYLQETRHGARLRGSRLRGVLAIRRKIDSRIRQASEFPHWLMRKASQTASQFRSNQENNVIPDEGHSQIDNEKD
ncbi:MAG: hypothetical protein ACTSP0_04605 [Alphaproteobacteria bacterium]